MAEIIREHKVTAREFTIKTRDRNILCIVGNHINGAYLAIPSFGLSVELTDDGNIEDNSDRILMALDDIRSTDCKLKSISHMKSFSQEIAEVINPHITTEQSPEEIFKSIMGVEKHQRSKLC